LIHPPGPHELHLWHTNLVAEQADLRELSACLSADEQARAARFRFAHDRNRFVVARGRLRQLLGRYLAVPPAELRFAYSANGKPYMAEPYSASGLCFNLAHSGNLALYAVTYQRPVGIDVEQLRSDLDFHTMIPTVFSPVEQHTLAQLPAEEQRMAFFQGWVCKEAYLKACGKGLSIAPNQFATSLPPAEPALFLPPNLDDGTIWSIQIIDVEPGYIAAVVVENPPPDVHWYVL
jgi:4'-phosphopantetheinyl transferase